MCTHAPTHPFGAQTRKVPPRTPDNPGNPDWDRSAWLEMTPEEILESCGTREENTAPDDFATNGPYAYARGGGDEAGNDDGGEKERERGTRRRG